MKNKPLLLVAPVVALLLLFAMSACQPAENRAPEVSQGPAPPAEPLTVRTPATENAAVKNTVIGSCTTPILDRNKNRINNIALAMGDLDGKVIGPGETFSYNGTVGRRTAEEGYRKARIILNGKKAWGRGGGVCQVSSTLYSALKEAGVQIVERHPHSKRVPYIPKGRDAMVVYGSKDLRFKNNRSYPVKIAARVADGKVNIDIVEIKTGE